MNRYDSNGNFLMINLMSERKAQGLSQSELGKLIGMNHVQISRIESGLQMPLASTLYKIAKVLGVSMDWLMEGFEPDRDKGEESEEEVSDK